jgi:DNA-binding protein HU-beta
VDITYKFVKGVSNIVRPQLFFNNLKYNFMNKTDLISGMAENAGITKAAAKKALDSLLVDIEGSLQKGNRVSLVGFGSWSVSKRSAREGRNPQTGKTIQIKAKNVVKFKAGSDLSSAVY